MHCGKKWWIREFVAPYIFPLNPDYVAARSLRSLRSNRKARFALLHGSSTNWFQTSRYCRAKVEFNSINWVRHGSSTTFETGLILSNDRFSKNYLMPGVHVDFYLNSVQLNLELDISPQFWLGSLYQRLDDPRVLLTIPGRVNHEKTKWTTFFSIFVFHPIFHNWIYWKCLGYTHRA